MDTASWYRGFAEREANTSSPQYERLALAVAESDELIEWLSQLPARKRQPNLLFASVSFLGGATDSVAGLVEFVRTNSDRLATTMTSRSTQTNEVARCGAFLPVLAELDAPIALIEVGASAGLCLFPDRYSYSYDGVQVGESPLRIDVDTGGTVTPPAALPSVVWRAGLDLDPLDVSEEGDLAWLRACVWPEHHDRRRRLELAAAIVADDPPRIDRGDLSTGTMAVIDRAPRSAMKVLFHSAVLPYLEPEHRAGFCSMMRELVEGRDDLVWLSNEAPGLVPGVPDLDAETGSTAAPFLLIRNGTESVARTDPHGAWITRLA